MPRKPISDATLDPGRRVRIGLDEAIFCSGKSPAQIAEIVATLVRTKKAALLTRLDAARFEALPAVTRREIAYDALSFTAVCGRATKPGRGAPPVAIVTAGTSDLPVAREAAATLRYYGVGVSEIADVGVAGLWRLTSRIEEIRRHRIVIVVAGMDAALPSVLGGLVKAPVIAVPTSVGYGVATGGQTALNAMLASCAPGIVVVNIDNGYGAACAALRMLNKTIRG